jgi:mannose-6-phosphate isomerase-like protein (cupin superfamily)
LSALPRARGVAPDDHSGIAVVRGTAAPTRRGVEDALRGEGLEPRAWANGGGVVYEKHAHAHHKVLVCVSGGIVFHSDGGDVALGPGDRMELPPGVVHGATVSGAGVECVEAFVSDRVPDAGRG